MNRRKLAQDYFKQGYTCSQSVVMAFSDILSIDRRSAMAVSSSFGGGFGRLREICGTVSAMGIVLGDLYYKDSNNKTQAKAEQYKRIQQAAGEFKQINGTIICEKLLGKKIQISKDPTPEERTEEYYRIRPCAKFVDDAVKILEKYIAENDFQK